MSSSLSLDASAADRLAGLDPTLSLLSRALPPTTSDPPWVLHDVRWTPGEGCRLAYRAGKASTNPTFLAVDVTGAGWSHHDYRDDAALPGLRTAADPMTAAALIGPLAGEGVRCLRVEPVRYRPRSRCVLRYDVETASTRSTLFAKVLPAEGFDDVASLCTAVAAPAGGVSLVPEITAVWPRQYVLVGRGVTGRTVSAVLGDPAVPAGERARVAQRLGELLARFHGLTGVSAPLWSAADQVAALAASMAAAQRADAGLARRLGAALEVLAAALPPDDGVVVGHGAFRAGQVIVTGAGDLVALDTDGASRCDPARDLGTVLAHLTWQRIRTPGQQQTLRAAERALLSGYRSHAADVPPQALLWWRVAGLLQVALRRFRRLEIQTWPLVHALADATDALLAECRTRATTGAATDLLDLAQMSTVLRTALAPVTADPDAVRVDSAEQLATATPRRCVVRYTVRGLDGAGDTPVIAKTFAEPWRARLLHDHLSMLSAGPFARGPLRVPRPLGLLPALRLVLYRPAAGIPLDELLGAPRGVDGVRQAARWLARLHSCDLVLPRRFSLSREAESTRQWAALIGAAQPLAAAPARELADRWPASLGSAAATSATAIHKDFHAGHVLVGDGVCVIDLDEARQGDPAFDLAHFCAYLDLCGHAGASLRSAFLTEYVEATGWADAGTFAPFSAYSWLKIAKQCAVGSGPYRTGAPVPGSSGRGSSAVPESSVRGLAGVESALAKGAAWLSA